MSDAAPAPQQSYKSGKNRETIFNKDERAKDVRALNIVAAKTVADTVRTSLGPRGMDKMIRTEGDDNVTITNDGATILKKLRVGHPTAQMLVDLSASQDIEAGDGTTSVVVLCGSLLTACQNLMAKGIHPTLVSDAFKLCVDKASEILHDMAKPINLDDREFLIKSAITSLSSKIVSQHSDILAPMAVDSVLKVVDPTHPNFVDLNDVKIVKHLHGTVSQSELIDGLAFNQGASHKAGGPTNVKNAKIGLIQFCISPPKTDMDNNVIVNDYTQIDRILREERAYLLNICKQIKKTGCNVLLIQKSVLRDAVTNMSLHFLAKMKIMVVRDIERDDMEFISKTLGVKPVSSVDHFTKEKLAHAEVCQEISTGGGKIVKVTGIKNKGNTVTALLRASNRLMLDEAERSLHDALCVIRSLVKKQYIIAGGGAPEIELALKLAEYAKTLKGVDQYVAKEYAQAFEIIPTTLAENAGLRPISVVTDLRNRHALGQRNTGINVRKGVISDMYEENVVQPLLVTLSAVGLATETSRMILKIDAIV
eukprot:CAMPEP_0117451116 /NCGR_PEP_ID=MMETSP0759-20121206/8833_1 /TAXON_ID=63605 /ORGANISM="Percolomonas cosmopolitus, Strain WS" /LENGTH=536 /DNA_ID=CAMNT_0005243689 /DNA_START=61 /DNA_END=1671 /DNA_ORIENTATION=-